MAGTSHADAYTITVGLNDTGDGNGAVRCSGTCASPSTRFRLTRSTPVPTTGSCSPRSTHLDTWVRTGVAPPVGPLLEVVSTSPVVLARDANGNALGGVRSPHVDAPIATLLGTNTGAGFCRLFGTTTPFSPAQLLALYPTHTDFVNQWVGAVYQGVAAGFILPADASELAAAGVSSTVPN